MTEPEPHEIAAAGIDESKWLSDDFVKAQINKRKREWVVVGVAGVCAGIVAAFAILMKVILL